MPQFAVIIAAAGKSTRFGGASEKKVFVDVEAKPLWKYSAERFAKRDDVDEVIVVVASEDCDAFRTAYAAEIEQLRLTVVPGGRERADSVRNGLQCIASNIRYVAIHDAARPYLVNDDITAVFAAAVEHDAAVLATPCVSTIKRADHCDAITETLPRQGIWLAQTPQVFLLETLRRAYAVHPNPSAATDEASLVEHLLGPGRVQLVSGSPLNIKVTTKSDLEFIKLALVSQRSNADTRGTLP